MGKSISVSKITIKIIFAAFLVFSLFCQAVFASATEDGKVYSSPNGDGYTPYNLQWEENGLVSFNVVEPDFTDLGRDMVSINYDITVWRDQ